MTTTNTTTTLSPPPSYSCYSKLSLILLFTTLITLTIIFQLQPLKQPPFPLPAAPEAETAALLSKLRDSITFLPLKDLRFSDSPATGHTWFMSSVNDTTLGPNDPEHLFFPSPSSRGRILCLSAPHPSDGTKNLYAFAYRAALPRNSTLLPGLTVVSDTQYDYSNLWHGLAAVVPFVAWREENRCGRPERWVLFHWGELRTEMGSWVKTLTEAAMDGAEVRVENLGSFRDVGPVCFERAVVFRHNEGGLSRERRGEVYDTMRCKARRLCGVEIIGGSDAKRKRIRTTLLLRDGGRAFKNETTVIRVFDEECRRVEGCEMKMARPGSLTFCDQVRLMSETDILVTAHGAQMTNMIFMDRNSSILELYPKGWLEFAGVGQYVYLWMADWAGMRHRGAWRDQEGHKCPYHNPADCFTFYKDGKIGHDQHHFSTWMATVLREVKEFKLFSTHQPAEHTACPCD